MTSNRLRRPTTGVLLFMGVLGAFGSAMEIQMMQGPARIPPDTGRLLLLAHMLAALLSLGPSSWVFGLPGVERRFNERRGHLLYYGLVALAAIAGSGVTHAFWVSLGQRAPGSPAWLIDATFLLATNISIVWFGMKDANARAAVAAGKKHLDETLQRLESVRVLNRSVPSQRHSEVIGALEQRIAPTLDALTSELDTLSTVMPTENEARLAPLLARLEHLREEEVRLLSHRLHPSIVDVGMIPALHFLVERFEPDLAIALELPFSTTREPPPETRLAFYRCAEEALENVRRHAGIGRATLQWRETDEGWVMIIRDHGLGFDPSRESHGLGLHVLEGRVGTAGGTWNLDTAPGKGTFLEVRVPRQALDASVIE